MGLTLKQVALHLGLNARNVHDILTKLGLDHKTSSLDEIRSAYIRHIREMAAGRGGEQQYDLTKQKARQAEADANLKTLQYLREVGHLVYVEEVEDALADWVIMMRAEVENSIERIVSAAEGQHGISIDRESINRDASIAFRAIEAYPSKYALIAEEGREENKKA